MNSLSSWLYTECLFLVFCSYQRCVDWSERPQDAWYVRLVGRTRCDLHLLVRRGTQQPRRLQRRLCRDVAPGKSNGTRTCDARKILRCAQLFFSVKRDDIDVEFMSAPDWPMERRVLYGAQYLHMQNAQSTLPSALCAAH